MSGDGPAPPHPPAISSGESARVPAWGSVRRNRHVTVPLALPALFIAAGFAARANPHWRGELAAGAAVAAAGMHFHAPHKWDRRSEQWYARLSVLAAGGWLCASAWLGVSWLMLAVLGALSLAWGLPWYLHKRPRNRQRGRGIAGEWDAWWQHHSLHLGLVGSGVADVTTRGTAETLRIQLWAGRQTIRAVEQAVPMIESALAGYVPHGGIRVAKVPGNPSQALLHLRRANPLGKSIEWTPSLVPMSVTEPAAIGLGEGGQWKRVVLARNWFVIGASRSGKSNELSLFLATLTGVPDALVWLIDRKGGRAARPWMAALDWPAVTIDEARTMLRVAQAEVEARASYAYDGTEQLTPSAEVPAIFVVIDETFRVTSMMSGDTECARLLAAVASMGMGVAVYVIVLTQYGALEESVRTEQTRSNLPNRICFQVARPEHGAFALSDWQKLDPSRLDAAGSFYCQLGPKAPSEPFRAPEMTHDLVRGVAAANAAMPRQPLRLYAAAEQGTYDARWSRLPDTLRFLVPGKVAPGDGSPVADMPPGAVPAFADRLARICEADGPEVDLTALRFPPDDEIRSGTERRKMLLARDLMTAGGDGVSPDRLCRHTGLSRSMVHQLLASLTSDGAVIKVSRGRYCAAPGRDVQEAMGAIRRGQDRLLAEAAAS